MAQAKPVVIEARLNEWSMRDVNPNVPWTPQEIADDAYACWRAGASIVHFHVRGADGAPAHDLDRYADAIRAIRERCDILIHPTLAGVITPDPLQRLAPLKALCDDPSTRPDFAPLDMGSTNLDCYDPMRRMFTTEQKTYVNSVGALRQMSSEVVRLGLKPLLCAWTVPCLRTIDAFVDAGWISADPAVLCVVLTDGGILGGHPGTLAGLDSMLAFLPEREIEWSVCCREGDLMPIAAAAMARGGHVSIGLGDYVYPELGSPTNARLVEAIVAEARAHGRSPASVAQTRQMYGFD
ncbi:MAG: 3-keto-5-aminohexanoate cleavage protein [Lautropia sp.]